MIYLVKYTSEKTGLYVIKEAKKKAAWGGTHPMQPFSSLSRVITYLNSKLARWVVPSVSFSESWRQVPPQPLSVFQT
jgi:hypothetical protein